MPAPQEDRAEGTLVMSTAALAAATTSAPPRVHVLVLVEGWAAGHRQTVTTAPVVIGRAADCTLPVPDHQVSSHHLTIRSVAHRDDLLVTDMRSTNGTFIDGVRLHGDGWLPRGGLLRIGGQLFRHDHLSAAEAAQLDEHQRDLDKARHYVSSLLPAPVTEGPVRTDWVYEPCALLGGDAFGCQRLDDHTLAFHLIDVSGHCVGAAMHSVSVMNVLRQRALPGTDFQDPAQVLASLNAMFQMDAHDGMYFSIWYGVYDEATRTLAYASGGHHPSLLVQAAGEAPQPLRTRNLVIGAVPAARFTADRTSVAPGARLYVFSDGVFEIVTADGAQRDLPDFERLLLLPPAADGQESRRLHAAVRAVARPGPLDDDFTLLCVTFL